MLYSILHRVSDYMSVEKEVKGENIPLGIISKKLVLTKNKQCNLNEIKQSDIDDMKQ